MSEAPAFLDHLELARRAWRFAAEMHFGQRRAFDGAPFIEHPQEVACLLYGAGCSDELIAAGILHDTVELTRASLDDVADRFGARVGRLVAAVTEDPTIRSYRQRKAALRAQAMGAGEDAAVLFAADKLSKTREYRQQLSRVASGGRAPRPRRLSHYVASLADLEGVIPGNVLVVELRNELEQVTPLLAPAALH
jgi:(p)ppGpp synthase/HD superfamily hydrolase